MKKILFALLVFCLLLTPGCKKDEDSNMVETYVDGNGISHLVIQTKLCFKDNLPCIKYIDQYVFLDPDYNIYNGEKDVKLSEILEGTMIKVNATDIVIEELPHYRFKKVYSIVIIK